MISSVHVSEGVLTEPQLASIPVSPSQVVRAPRARPVIYLEPSKCQELFMLWSFIHIDKVEVKILVYIQKRRIC